MHPRNPAPSIALLALTLCFAGAACGDAATPDETTASELHAIDEAATPEIASAEPEAPAEVTAAPTGRRALEAARGVAQSTLEEAEEALAENTEAIEEARADLQEAEADVEAAQQQLEQAREKLTRAETARNTNRNKVEAARADLERLATPDPLLFRAVQSALLEARALSDVAIAARVERGRVTLEGAVDDTDTREAAEEIAAAVSGVTAVDNRIQVRQ